MANCRLRLSGGGHLLIGSGGYFLTSFTGCNAVSSRALKEQKRRYIDYVAIENQKAFELLQRLASQGYLDG